MDASLQKVRSCRSARLMRNRSYIAKVWKTDKGKN